jgi:chromosome segregation ATPase
MKGENMTVPTQERILDSGASAPPQMKMRLLIQIAETLEDEAAGLFRRAAASEEEEFLLNREIEERQTEINRLILTLEAIQAERNRLMERIDSICGEATAIREEIFNREEEIALGAIEASSAEQESAYLETGDRDRTHVDPAGGATFFRRMAMAEKTSIS